MAQPAPRMMSAPAPKRNVVERTVGSAISGVTRVLARRVDQRHGRKRYMVPAGLSRRTNSAYGTNDRGK